MTENNEYSGGKRIKSVAVVAGIGILAVLLCVLYLGFLNRVIYEETSKYLTEISDKTVQIVRGEIDDNFADLELMAKSVEVLSRDPESSGKILGLLEDIADIYDYSRIGIMGIDGDAWLSGGYKPYFVDAGYVKKAMAGERAVSDLTISPIDGEEILIYAVPVKRQDNRVIGVLAWSRSVEMLHDKLKITTFYNEGHSHLLSREGAFIIDNETDAVRYGTIDNFLKLACRGVDEAEIAGLMEDLENGRNGFISYEKGGRNYIGAYAPLGVNDWFLLDAIPEEVVNGAFDRAMKMGAVMVGCIVILCLIFIAYTVGLQKKHMDRLEVLAFEDPVTGGGNLTYFREAARKAIRRSPPGTYAMVAMDVNRFKLINVIFSQEAGDRTLKYIHRILNEGLQPGEILARMGQDQFRLLLKNTSTEQLAKRLEEYVERIQEYNANLERKYYLSFSAGIRIVDEPDNNIIIIGDQANIARKKAKSNVQAGLLSWAVYEAQDKTDLMREKEILDGLDRAIGNHEFQVYLQPKIDPGRGGLVGAEALVRWILPDGSMVRPDEFIPVLEQNGRISGLDLYMFREVCGILKDWETRGFAPVPVSVNFSRINMMEKNILKQYQNIQTEMGVSPELLEIELTETMIQGDMGYFHQLIDEIHKLGYRCSMDDFGSGYSSLNTLKDLPVDAIKLERLFFRSEGRTGERERKIVHGIIQIAKSLGICTVAEGVELEGQVKDLAAWGCDMIQGYYYSKPIPVEEFEEKYRKELDRT